ncbi:hypothetical protein AAC387_Pa11g0084 [Persea americana]
MWDYLKKIYQQGNAARQFQLELDISQFTQGTQSIQEYYNGFRRLWSEYDEIKFATVSDALLPELLPLQQSSHRDQFLMKLRREFETVRSNLMSRASLPSLDDCLQELLRENSVWSRKLLWNNRVLLRLRLPMLLPPDHLPGILEQRSYG